MSKIKENDLNRVLEEFKTPTTLELEFEKSINGRIKLENATITYDNKYGFIDIESQKASFQINTTLVYSYEIKDEIIYIDLDGVLLMIKKSKLN